MPEIPDNRRKSRRRHRRRVQLLHICEQSAKSKMSELKSRRICGFTSQRLISEIKPTALWRSTCLLIVFGSDALQLAARNLLIRQTNLLQNRWKMLINLSCMFHCKSCKRSKNQHRLKAKHLWERNVQISQHSTEIGNDFCHPFIASTSIVILCCFAENLKSITARYLCRFRASRRARRKFHLYFLWIE